MEVFCCWHCCLLFLITDLIEQSLLWAPLLSINATFSHGDKSLVQIQKQRKPELNSIPSIIFNTNYTMLLLHSKNLGWLLCALHTGWSRSLLQPHDPVSYLQHTVLKASWTACQSLDISYFLALFCFSSFCWRRFPPFFVAGKAPAFPS